jgi:hypothetical protein
MVLKGRATVVDGRHSWIVTFCRRRPCVVFSRRGVRQTQGVRVRGWVPKVSSTSFVCRGKLCRDVYYWVAVWEEHAQRVVLWVPTNGLHHIPRAILSTNVMANYIWHQKQPHDRNHHLEHLQPINTFPPSTRTAQRHTHKPQSLRRSPHAVHTAER